MHRLAFEFESVRYPINQSVSTSMGRCCRVSYRARWEKLKDHSLSSLIGSLSDQCLDYESKKVPLEHSEQSISSVAFSSHIRR